MVGDNLDRRDVLKGIGGVTAIGGVVGGGVLLSSDGASARSTTTTNIDGAVVGADDGDVNWVGVSSDSNISWDGFDTAVDRLRFTVEVTIDNSTIDGGVGYHTVQRTTSDPLEEWSPQGGNSGWGGAGEYVIENAGDGNDPDENGYRGEVHTDIKWAVIYDGDASEVGDDYRVRGISPADYARYLDVDADGETKTRTVKLRSTTEFLDADGNVIPDSDGVSQVRDVSSFDVRVTNQEATAGATGGGDSVAE